jgi:hypothetical protein
MINNYNTYTAQPKNKILIDEDFPEEKLVKIMKPYLLLFYKSEYSLVPHIKFSSLNALTSKLNKFQKYNPIFGRKTVSLKKKITSDFKRKTYIRDYTFNDRHILFNSNDNDNFLVSHKNIVFNDDSDYENYNNEDNNNNDDDDDNDEDEDNDNDNNNVIVNQTNNGDSYSDVSESSEDNYIIENNMVWNNIDSDSEM